MTKKEIKRAEELLDERWNIAFMDNKEEGRKPDLVFYKGMLSLIEVIGCNWTREEGNHKIFNN